MQCTIKPFGVFFSWLVLWSAMVYILKMTTLIMRRIMFDACDADDDDHDDDNDDDGQ